MGLLLQGRHKAILCQSERYLAKLEPKESICREVPISTSQKITLTMKRFNQPADAGGI